MEVVQHVREGLGRRLLHRQHLDAVAIEVEMVAVAVERRIGDVEIEVGVVFERCRLGLPVGVVAQAPHRT